MSAPFRDLHTPGRPLLVANAWDAGSARLLESLGFAALATSSGAFAATLGRSDGQVTRTEALAHARALVEAVGVPVSADLENGFGPAPGDAAETIRLAAMTGLAGASIEDATGAADEPLYDTGHAAERIAAAAEAARAAPGDFVLTARSEGFIRGRPDLDATIRRLQAYESAGADVLMAPGLPDLGAVRAVCGALEKPFSFMVGMKDRSFSVATLAEAGVARITLATALYRAAMTGLAAAAREVLNEGSFGFVGSSISSPELAGLIKR